MPMETCALNVHYNAVSTRRVRANYLKQNFISLVIAQNIV